MGRKRTLPAAYQAPGFIRSGQECARPPVWPIKLRPMSRDFLRMNSLTSPAGQRAHCSTCKALCCRLTVVLHAEDHVPEHLTTYSSDGLHLMKRGEDGWCSALNTARMNCSIYETRPSACRRFVMNGPYCKAIRTESH
jgi:uncharacterized protein